MNILKGLFVHTMLSLIFFICNAEATQNTEEILSKIRENFNNISSIHAESAITKTLEKSYLDIEPEADLTLPTTFTFDYSEKGDSFDYRINSTTKGKEGLVVRHARSNELDQYFSKKDGGRLVISRKPSDKEWLTTDNPVLLPYGFLFRDDPHLISDYFVRMPSLSDLLKQDIWMQLFNNRTIKLSQPAGSDIEILAFSVQGGMDDKPYQSSEYTYEIQLSKKYNYFPIGFKKLNKSGIVVQEVICKEIVQANDTKRNLIFFYPKEIVYKGFNKNGQLLLTSISRINKLDINTIDDDRAEDLFNIDPNIANLVYDKDSNLHIRVPR